VSHFAGPAVDVELRATQEMKTRGMRHRNRDRSGGGLKGTHQSMQPFHVGRCAPFVFPVAAASLPADQVGVTVTVSDVPPAPAIDDHVADPVVAREVAVPGSVVTRGVAGRVVTPVAAALVVARGVATVALVFCGYRWRSAQERSAGATPDCETGGAALSFDGGTGMMTP
jgi:hypothetical protein